MKKILKILEILILAVTLTAMSCACSVYNFEHVHAFSYVEAIEATCEEDGNIAYYYCSECGKYYSDAEGNEEIELSDTIIAATGHSYESVVTEPTCTEQGYTTYTCSECGDSYVTDYTDATGHSLEYIEAIEASCEEAGNTAYYYCSECGKYYSDAEGNEEIELSDTIIAATGHSYESVVTEPTCTEQGYTTYTCSECGDSYVTDYTDATGHSYGEWSYYDEETHYRECSVCGNTEFAEHLEGTSATYTEQAVCADCGGSFGDLVEYSVSSSSAFTTDTSAETNWKYGYVLYSWDSESTYEYQDGSESFTFVEAEFNGSDAWTADGVEIKADWLNADSISTIAYTFEKSCTVTYTLTVNGALENSRFSIRYAVIGSDGTVKYWVFVGDYSSVQSWVYSTELTVEEGDTIYIMFFNEADSNTENNYPQAYYEITFTEKNDED